MKRTTTCLSILLVISCASAMNLSQVADSFVPQTNDYQVIKVDTLTAFGEFFPNFGKLVKTLINDVVLELYRQLRLQSHLLATTVNSVNEELQFELQKPEKNQFSAHIEGLMLKLNGHLGKYLELGPGALNTTMGELPAIENNELTKRFASYRPLKELFSNLPVILDGHFANIDKHIRNFYKDGWRSARDTYENVQNDFRREYLNGYLLDAFAKVVSNSIDIADFLLKHVKPKTWEQFMIYGSEIKRLYEEIKPVVREDL